MGNWACIGHMEGTPHEAIVMSNVSPRADACNHQRNFARFSLADKLVS
jgi:hypothetical protein